MAFNRDRRSGGGRDFGRRSFDGGRDRDRQMFRTVCSNCNKDCEVPFQPTGSKPVYCSDCFRSMGGGSDSRHDDRGSRRPSFDRDRFDSRDRSSNQPQPQYREQFETLNNKLDKIIKLLSSEKTMPRPKTAVEPVKKAKAKKSALVKDTVKTPTVVETPVGTTTPTEAPQEKSL